VNRLLVLWTHPLRRSDQEVEDWLREEAVRLHRVPAVRRLALTRLARASDRHARPADWLLEIELDSDVRGEDCVDDPLFAQWLGDMRLLGMRPQVVLADRTQIIEADDG
jgi:hypothetical protein